MNQEKHKAGISQGKEPNYTEALDAIISPLLHIAQRMELVKGPYEDLDGPGMNDTIAETVQGIADKCTRDVHAIFEAF